MNKILIFLTALILLLGIGVASAKTYPSDYPAGLGIYDAGTYESLQDENNTEITWHIVVRSVSLPDSDPSKNVGYESGGVEFNNTHIDDGTSADILSQISKANTSANLDHYDYGTYFLVEEMMSPAYRAGWAVPQTKMKYYHVGNKTTLMGIKIKQIKVWCEEDKGIEWDVSGGAACTRDWWTTISNANTYTDPTYVEWSTYWATNTYTAWHLYMRSLGKKSMITGISGTGSQNISNSLKNTYYKSPTWEYIFANYDAIVMYRYSKRIGNSVWSPVVEIGTAESSNDVWQIRNKFNYSGKLIWFMTQCWGDGAGCPFEDDKSYDEFRRVYTDVDAVIGKPRMNGTSMFTVPYLLKYKHRSIVSWGNTKTGDHRRNFSVSTNEAVTFNASKHSNNSESSVVTWRWFKDGVQVGTNSSYYTAAWTSSGSKLIEVNATLSSGHTTNTMYWDVTVNSNNPVPALISWTNTKTNNVSTSLTLNTSESLTYNVTANQAITTWTWYKDGVLVNNTSGSYTSSWDSTGTKSIKVNGTNSNGTTNTITWTIIINPVNSPKFGVGGAAWNSVGTSFNVYNENSKLKLGFWGDNFDHGLYDWTTESGTISVLGGKLLMSGSTFNQASKVIGNHSNVAFFANWNESVNNYNRAFSIRSDTSRSNPGMNYWASARSDGSGIWIVKHNGTAWININETGAFARTNGSTSYCIEKGYGSTFKVYCSHKSYDDALENPPVSQGIDTQFAYGNRIRLEGNSNTTWDNLRIVLLDASGNIINSGSKTISYDAGSKNQSKGIIINATTPPNTNYTVSYRQKNVGSWIQINGVYTGNQTLPITGIKYQDTEINITLNGNGTSFPEIETVEFSRQQVSTIIPPRYDVNEDGVVDIRDLILVYQNLNEDVPSMYPRYDVNMDGRVNVIDLSIIGKHFGEHI